MLEPRLIHDWLSAAGVRFYAGVPDSLLKDFCAFVTDTVEPARHVITANEGGAIALAMGHHLATAEVPLVYMQNSGLGNTVNPLTSLADPAVYGIPMLLMIGWRGEPGHEDEPQHVKMGAVTCEALDAIGVRYSMLPNEPADAERVIASAIADARARQAPHALVVRAGTFAKYALNTKPPTRYALSREEAIVAIVETMRDDAIVVSTTGKPSRELFEVRAARAEPHRDLLIVGGMGHASQIALGVALAKPERDVWCLDGDGAALMHLGGMATIATLAPQNYHHVILNNAAHESVGGQPTVAFEVDLCQIARACGYAHVACAEDDASLRRELGTLALARGPALLEVRIKVGSRADLGRPTMSPAELKTAFMQHVRG